MTTTRKLTDLAATIADDLDTMAALPADRITNIAIGQPDLDKPERVRFTLGEGFDHPTAERQAAFAATAAWLRDTLPALIAEHDAHPANVDDDEQYGRFYPEAVADVLISKMLVDADVTAYWQTDELDGVLDGRDVTLMYTAAATFGLAWTNYLEKASMNLANGLDLTAERLGRHGDRIPA